MSKKAETLDIEKSHSGVKVVSISHEFNYKTISKIHSDLLIEINSSNEHQILVEINNIHSIDLTAIQYLLALKKSSEDTGRKIEIQLSLNEEQTVLFKNSGFHKILPLK